MSAQLSCEDLLAHAIKHQHTDGFTDALFKWLEASVGCDNIAAIAYFQDRRPTILGVLNHHASVHAELKTQYVEAAYLLDPFHQLHIKNAQTGVYRLTDIAPDHFRRNKYFISYYRHTTLVDEIAFISYPSKGVSVHVCLGRDSNSNAKFTSKQLKNAQRIAPIVTILAKQNWSKLHTIGTYSEEQTVLDLIQSVEKNHDVKLTPRQAEVAFLILKGHSSLSIGLNLGVARTTVKVFRKQLYKRLNISTQIELFNMLLPQLRQ